MDVKIGGTEGVYSPREDSYLLAGVVERLAHGDVLDLGTGSGIQGITAALNGCKVTFSDIDGHALEAARANAELNRVTGKFIRSDMFSAIEGKFDIIIFNPPYLPSGKEKEATALDGGKKGRELIEKFLERYKSYLKPGGLALLVESSFNGYEKEVNSGGEVLAKAHYFFEDLVVIGLR
jgi:release factor glutamine methyltransferase